MKNEDYEIFEPIDQLGESWGHKTLLKWEFSANSVTGFRWGFVFGALRNLVLTYFWLKLSRIVDAMEKWKFHDSRGQLALQVKLWSIELNFGNDKVTTDSGKTQ